MNISQITNFDLADRQPDTTKSITFPGDEEPTTVGYITWNPRATIIKLGYVCEPKGINYPISLKVNGDFKNFNLGKTGMFEIQPEIFKDINDTSEEAEEENIVVEVTEVQFPVGIIFKFDYVTQ